MSQQNRVSYTTLCPLEHTEAGEFPVWFDMDEKTFGCDGPTGGEPHRFDSLPEQVSPEPSIVEVARRSGEVARSVGDWLESSPPLLGDAFHQRKDFPWLEHPTEHSENRVDSEHKPPASAGVSGSSEESPESQGRSLEAASVSPVTIQQHENRTVPASAIQWLQKALALKPDYTEAREALNQAAGKNK